jgi:hypothetical protein
VVVDSLKVLDPKWPIREADLLRRFGLTEVERVAFPNSGSWSFAANNGILASLDGALDVARDRGAEEIVLALCWNDTRGIELIRDKLRDSPLPVQLLPDQRVRYLTENPAFSVNRLRSKFSGLRFQNLSSSQSARWILRALALGWCCCRH